MKAPVVSVVMPAFRCAGTIGAAVASVLAQNVPLELIIVDDQPEENLEAVLGEYLLDPRVILLRNETNLGAAQSRNRGVAAARGEYIAFLDADDIWAPGKLEKQLARLAETGMVLCATARELITPEGTHTGRIIPVRPVITYRALLRHNAINCSSVVVRAEAVHRFPMAHEDSHEDYILWLKILKTYGPACAINEPLLYYRLSSTGKSGSKFRSARMTYRAYRYSGFSRIFSTVLFVSYAIHGVAKYALSRDRRKK